MSYAEFLEKKRRFDKPQGIADGYELNPMLFGFQRDCVRFALRRGRAALFEDCGLGKTFQQLEWARVVAEKTKGRVIILAPLAVAQQTIAEGRKLGIEVQYCRKQEDVSASIVITNYEMLHHFDANNFSGVVLDECFPAGTKIDTPKGRINIENIRKGMYIENITGADVVSDVHRREVKYAVKVTFNGTDTTSSPNHPFFTQRGWVGAQHLRAGDYLLEPRAAMSLVRDSVRAEMEGVKGAAILRDILLSEMAYDATGDIGSSALAGSSFKTRIEEECLVQNTSGGKGVGAHCGDEPNDQSRGSGEDKPHLETHEAQTFSAWGKWQGDDIAAIDSDGCFGRRMESGVCCVVGETKSRLSNMLQARLRESEVEIRNRGGWKFASCAEGSGFEERFGTGFIRVDGIEILESGHPELEKLRDADGKLYFYDLGATRHPSYSVNGVLVHNSSILKNFTGKTRTAIIDAFVRTPFKLSCTATPAPNDYMELGNQAEFLGVMTRAEMLAMYFVHDGGDTSQWRLKGHAEEPFWKWMCTWAVCLQRPSDIGHSDEGYELPPLTVHKHIFEAVRREGFLISMPAETLTDQRAAKREGLAQRVSECARLVNESKKPWVCWGELNDECNQLEKLIPDAVQVAGCDSVEDKESRLIGFADGKSRVMISKSSIAGFGLNWQHCSEMAFVNLSHSFEDQYQAIRRCWRFGQKNPVNVHLFLLESEIAILENVERKKREADAMAANMIRFMKSAMADELGATVRNQTHYKPKIKLEVPTWMQSTKSTAKAGRSTTATTVK